MRRAWRSRVKEPNNLIYSAASLALRVIFSVSQMWNLFGSFTEPFTWQHCLTKKLIISHHFNCHFPGRPGSAGTRMSPFWILFELMVMEWVVATSGAINSYMELHIAITTGIPGWRNGPLLSTRSEDDSYKLYNW